MTTRSTALASPDPERPPNPAPVAVVSIDDLLKDLGRNLLERRQLRGLSRINLARRIGYSYGTVAGAEYGNQTRSRVFWQRADQNLRAKGALLAAAEEVSLRQAAVKREQLRMQQVIEQAIQPLAPYRQVQKINRTFADRLGTIAARRQRHPHMIETAVRQQARVEQELNALIETIRTLLGRPDFTPHDVLTDLWRTLLIHDPYHASFLSAAALMELAQERQPRPAFLPEDRRSP
jgi:hypothetical protein